MAPESQPPARVVLLEAQLARALPEVDRPGDRRRLAELLVEAADARSLDESASIRRDIELRIAEEFERIAGLPIGDVVSRLDGVHGGAPRPPRPSPDASDD